MTLIWCYKWFSELINVSNKICNTFEFYIILALRGAKKGKKKKRKAIMKLLLIGAVLKAKLELFLKLLATHLQIKFFIIALIGLFINVAKFWIDLKRGHSPQKVNQIESNLYPQCNISNCRLFTTRTLNINTIMMNTMKDGAAEVIGNDHLTKQLKTIPIPHPTAHRTMHLTTHHSHIENKKCVFEAKLKDFLRSNVLIFLVGRSVLNCHKLFLEDITFSRYT